MSRKSIGIRPIAAALAAALALSPAAAVADNAFVGGLVGGIIGGAIANSARQQPQKKVYRSAPARKPVYSAAREQNREVQHSLNYFGFNAGGADGVLGSRSRTAISGFQAHLGYPVTGQLTEFERSFLVGSYHRAQSGGPATAQLVASNPQGLRGLLTIYREEQMNGTGGMASASIGGHYGLPSVVAAAVNEIARSSDPSAEQLVQRSGFIQLADMNGDGQTDYILDTSVTGSAFWCNAQSCAVRVFASTPDGYERNDFQAFNVTPAMFSCTRGTCTRTGADAPMMAATPAAPQPAAPQATIPVASAVPSVNAGAVAAAPAVPQFFGAQEAAPSLASHCNMVSLVTTTNGGFTTAEDMTDPAAALGEQMCLSRTYAIANGETLIQKIPNATPQAVAGQCGGFGALLTEQVSAISVQSREDVLRATSSFVLSAGMAPQQLETTARVCLASGYQSDDMDTAIGSALVLVALGQAPYAELVGHHLSQGFGATQRRDLAVQWYNHAMAAVDGGATPVFGSALPERVDLLRAAVARMPGNNLPPEGSTVRKASAIPLFGLPSD
jgi:peptidoglycan hydrolase-like protein with peptidoglycan-binding domain